MKFECIELTATGIEAMREFLSENVRHDQRPGMYEAEFVTQIEDTLRDHDDDRPHFVLEAHNSRSGSNCTFFANKSHYRILSQTKLDAGY